MADRYCSNCASNIFRPITFTDIMNYRGSNYEIEYDAMQCVNCKEAFLTGEQSQLVSSRLVNSWRKDNDLLSSQELMRIRNKIGYSKAKLERLLKRGENTIIRWEKDLSAQNSSIDRDYRVLDLADERPDLVKKLFPDIDLSKILHGYESITSNLEVTINRNLQDSDIICENSESIIKDSTKWKQLRVEFSESDLLQNSNDEVQRVSVGVFSRSGIQLAA